MKKVARKFKSHAEADAANRAYYKSLTPEQRLEILCELVNRHMEGLDEASRRFQRV